MDIGILIGVVMLIGWAISTFMYNGPGWVHLFLTLGVSIIIWRIVARGTRTPPVSPDQPE